MKVRSCASLLMVILGGCASQPRASFQDYAIKLRFPDLKKPPESAVPLSQALLEENAIALYKYLEPQWASAKDFGKEVREETASAAGYRFVVITVFADRGPIYAFRFWKHDGILESATIVPSM